VQVEPTSEAAHPLNSQFNRLWNAPEPVTVAGEAGKGSVFTVRLPVGPDMH